MNKFVILFLIFTLNAALKVDQWILFKSAQIQHWCVRQTHSHFEQFSEIGTALICGERLQSHQQNKIFKKTGLIHLIVVSGSHLILIATVLSLFCNHWILGVLLLLYSLLTGLQPPILRALIGLLISSHLERQVYRMGLWEKELCTLFIALFIIPTYMQSLSLTLSSCCAIAITLNKDSNPFIKSTCLFLALLPILLIVGSPNIFAVLVNATIGFVLSILLLPLALLCLLPIPFTQAIFSKLISSTLAIGERIPQWNLERSQWIDAKWTTLLLLFFLITAVLFKQYRQCVKL